ncbi:MAG: IS1380 family transposase, partial [Acidobacteriaceae bacterium]
PSPTESPLLFEIDDEPLQETLTAWSGVPLVVQAFRSLGVPARVRQHVQIKQRERGYDEATMVESFVVLNAVGGECLDDFQHLRDDAGLKEMLGHEVPSPEAARQFLNRFHCEEKLEQARDGRKPEQIAFIPEEADALAGLGEVNRELVRELGRRCPDQRTATVDQDATIIESHKQQALRTYEGERGYQPMLAVWAEMDAVLADEFRDGNVPAMMAPLAVAKRAFAALPETVTSYYYRGDSASHEKELLGWLRDENRADGPQGKIGFAISARMSEALHRAISQVPEASWNLYGKADSKEIRECAEVDFVPGEKSEHKDTQPLRYVAIRIRPRQEEFFADGSQVKHFAVLSNLWEWKPERLIQWHREKAGMIEAVHDVLKNELAGGVMPSKYFGANAAWLRLAVISYNVLTALKRIALPAELLRARPKRLRFLIINTAGRLVQHARKMRLRLATLEERIALWKEALRLLPVVT